MPPDVRKASGFPKLTFVLFERLRLGEEWVHSPGGNFELDRKGKAFPHIGRQSRSARNEQR
jgi:hypothetical protein